MRRAAAPQRTDSGDCLTSRINTRVDRFVSSGSWTKSSVRRLYWRVAWLLAVHSLRVWLLADSPGVRAARQNDVES